MLSNNTIQIIKYADTKELAVNNNLTKRQPGFYVPITSYHLTLHNSITTPMFKS